MKPEFPVADEAANSKPEKLLANLHNLPSAQSKSSGEPFFSWPDPTTSLKKLINEMLINFCQPAELSSAHPPAGGNAVWDLCQGIYHGSKGVNKSWALLAFRRAAAWGVSIIHKIMRTKAIYNS